MDLIEAYVPFVDMSPLFPAYSIVAPSHMLSLNKHAVISNN